MTLNNRNKKSIEKLHFAYFKECCKELPSSISSEHHDDNPDFLVKHNSGVLGIELTQLFKVTKHPNAPQALESFRQQIVESAQKCCEDIPPLSVNVWFTFNQEVPKNRTLEINRIGKSLANLVKKWCHENPSKTFETLKPHLEISEIYQMIIARAWNGKTGLHYHLWTVECPAVVQNFRSEVLQNCIDEKSLRYKKYRNKCDECWLLIVVNLFKNSQSFEIPDRIDHKFKSKFERVYYMDASHRKDLRELHINRLKGSLYGNNVDGYQNPQS